METTTLRNYETGTHFTKNTLVELVYKLEHINPGGNAQQVPVIDVERSLLALADAINKLHQSN